MLMGGFYLAIDATAGERERGSLESLLTIPVPREQLIYGKIIASCAFMLLALVLTCAAFSVLLRFVGLERFGMSVEFGPVTALKMVAFCAPLSLLGASLMTIVAAFTRSYREAQTYVGVALFVPTLPLIFAGVAGWQPTTALMAVPALSQHFLMTSLLRAEGISALDLLISVGATILLGVILAWVAGRLYHREALLG
jgi:sodium transport system permease protein